MRLVDLQVRRVDVLLLREFLAEGTPSRPTLARRQAAVRGFFGWMFLLMFLGWNILMISWLVGYGGHFGMSPKRSGLSWRNLPC